MGLDAWFTVGVVALLFALMVFTPIATDAVLIGGVSLLMLCGILTEAEAFAGMANEGMLTVGVLFVVAQGVVETGGVTWIAEKLFGRPKSYLGAVARIMIPSGVLSAFMNNTPLVAMLIPAVGDWAKKCRIPPSKLMIPLSYAAILGGTCTLIGTSTNLVVNGMLIRSAKQEFEGRKVTLRRDNPALSSEEIEAQALAAMKLPLDGMSMFEISAVGFPSMLLGIAFVVFSSRWLLPNRQPALGEMSDPREYTVEMLVAPDSPLIGRSIEEAGLRHLPGLYLAEINREDTVLPAVAPGERLHANDRLVFVGVVDSVVELQKIRGLLPATDQVFKLSAPRSTRCLIEAVVSNTCPMVGKTIRDGRFRSVYTAAVIAVSRNGQRIKRKIGDIILYPGDMLLLEAHPSFVEQNKNSRDFFLVKALEDSRPPSHERALTSLVILGAMVTAVTMSDFLGPLRFMFGEHVVDFGRITMLKAGIVAAALMIATRCCTLKLARRSVDWEVLLAIAASLALGTALEKTGAAKAIADSFIGMAQGNPWGSLVVIYIVTLVITELITNNAAAALMFPMALATAQTLQVNWIPFVIAVMMGASNGFATPIGYQTNLMVQGPGGYRFTDYAKIGVPLDLLIFAVTVLLAPLVWPFR